MATAVLLAGAWLSSGTMAPYAATLDPKIVRVEQPCEYLNNIDHGLFQATFWMLQGKPWGLWAGSNVLRRILYPILAFPLMSAFGFEYGGFATNLLLTTTVFVGFVIFVRRVIGERGSVAAMWILATYPGIHYWIGLPYSYVWIVPGSLIATMLLWRLSREDRLGTLFFAALALGFVFWGYDLFPFFGTAAVLILARQRRFGALLIALLGMTLPVAALLWLMQHVAHVPVRNSNTETYYAILRSFSSTVDYPAWRRLLGEVPGVFADNFLFSNFLWLPLLFVLLVAVTVVATRSASIETPELEILLAGLLVFLINNLAPPYSGWQFRGVWIARLYQPLFTAFVLFASRAVQHGPERRGAALIPRAAAVLVGLTVIADAGLVFGPFLRLRSASMIYQRFYRHSGPESLYRNVELHGRRPLGFCKRDVR